jgi:hypothetical protein
MQNRSVSKEKDNTCPGCLLCVLEFWEIYLDFSMVVLVRASYVFSFTLPLSMTKTTSTWE